MPSELKTCPFCGSNRVLLTNWGLYRCWCVECKATTSNEITAKEAKEAWNRRTNDGQAD